MRKSMRRVATFLVLLSACYAACLAQAERLNAESDMKQFELFIQTFLEGKDLTAMKGMISAEAYIIHGGTYESVFNHFDARSRQKLFDTDKEKRMVFFAMSMNDEGTSAYVVVRTEGLDKSDPRYHTVVFARSLEKGWQLRHWHAGT